MKWWLSFNVGIIDVGSVRKQQQNHARIAIEGLIITRSTSANTCHFFCDATQFGSFPGTDPRSKMQRCCTTVAGSVIYVWGICNTVTWRQCKLPLRKCIATAICRCLAPIWQQNYLITVSDNLPNSHASRINHDANREPLCFRWLNSRILHAITSVKKNCLLAPASINFLQTW